MFIEYFHNSPDGAPKVSNGSKLSFATSAQAEAEGTRVRELPYSLAVGRLSHAIVTDDQGYREIFACAGQSADLAQAVADSDFDCDVL